ncbi:MAG: hypothetical protein LKH33_07850 [Acetobacter sp.]|jgi:hypothetical protein|nr:hypothetical protein [Acetobacter sp.]MCH4089373.1 hypothetical protein [Acetobacter sp.]MCI1294149.1 hypothetical protein [Acetobacter sp.]MCI1320734.1 hypothetical protein [Acetobacter sp.]MCI1374091.1 hypothetical protein [Acetobacter sp.]
MSASDGCGENPVAVFGALLYSGSSQFLPFQSVGIVDFLNVGTLEYCRAGGSVWCSFV